MQLITDYLTRHLQAGMNSLGKLSRSPIATFMTCLVIGIALALPAALMTALNNAKMLSGHFQETTQLTLYLKKEVTPDQATALLRRLKMNPEIETAHAVSPEDGLKELQQLAGFDGTLTTITPNPLPWVIIALPEESYRQPAAFEQLTHELSALPQVENIQVDMQWVQRLAGLFALIHDITYALGLFLGIGVLLIVNNTIQSALQRHRKEIDIIQLIGGTPAFIRRPFLYTGMIYGALGGVIAWLLVEVLIQLLRAPVTHLAALYDDQVILMGTGFVNALIIIGIGGILGTLGAWLAVTRQLHTSRTS